MEMKKILTLAFAILFLISSSAIISATTGSIGNAKMVLYPEVNGWTNTVIEKTISVNNVNDFAVNITLKPDSNATKFIDIIDESFILQPGEEKKAQIEIKVKKEGRYEGRINVFFKPVEGEDAGVVLSSTIVVFAKKDQGYDDSDTDNSTNTNTNDNTNTTNINTNPDGSKIDKSKFIKFRGLSTIILLIVLLILLYIWGKKRNQSKRKRKSK
jgi:hypothetical protein